MSPQLCKDVDIKCSSPPIATPKPWVHAGVQSHPTALCSPEVPRPTGSSHRQERSKLLLFPRAHPSRWPGSWVWSSWRGCHDEGRMKAR